MMHINKKPLIVDIDNTIIVSDSEICPSCWKPEYLNARPLKKEIKYVNKQYDNGRIIILYTGRSWASYIVTKQQLKKFGVKYHELVMGKPYGDYFDKDAIIKV